MTLSRRSTAAVLALVFASLAGLAQAAEQEKVGVSQKQPFGKYLTADEGRSVYMFTADSRGKSACDGACAQAWPPVMTSGKAKAASGVNAAMLGTIKRQDGATQVTYNGMPLYYFTRDQKPGSTMGQNIDHFGGEWYLVSPAGTKLEGKE